MQVLVGSNLIHEDLVHLIAREAEIPHGGRGAGMVEPLGQDFETHTILGPLDESKRLPQAVGPIVPMVQVDRLCPFLDQAVDGLDSEGLSCLAARKEVIVISRLDFLQVASKGLVDGLVDHENVLLSSLRLLDGDVLPGFEGFYVLYLHHEEVPRPKAVIDSHGKKQQIPWRSRQQLFYGLDVFASPDGVHPDLLTFPGMVGVFVSFHHAPSSGSRCFKVYFRGERRLGSVFSLMRRLKRRSASSSETNSHVLSSHTLPLAPLALRTRYFPQCSSIQIE